MKNLINYDLEEIQYPRKRNEYFLTTNYSVFRKYYGNHVKGCTICGFNRGCNMRDKHRHYGGKIYEDGRVEIDRSPNWKLYKKVKHQYVYAPLKKDVYPRSGFSLRRLDYTYFDYKVKQNKQ